MKIPDKIRIQGMEYGIEQVAGLSNGINRLLGEIQHTTLRIRLDIEQEPQRAAVTLWHEMIHAVIEHAGLDLGSDVEERVADTVAFGVYQILEDNIERLYPSVASLPSAEGVEASAGSGPPQSAAPTAPPKGEPRGGTRKCHSPCIGEAGEADRRSG